MNLDNIQEIWNSQNEKLDECIQLNKKLLTSIELDNSKSTMTTIQMWRIVEAVIFFIIVVVLWGYISDDFIFSAPIVSALTLNIFATIGLAGTIGQIVLISQIDYSKSVSSVQKQIYSIREHRLKVAKLTLLSIPFHMAYVFLGFDVLFSVNLYQYLSQAMINFYWIISLMMIPATIWMYRKLNFNNMKTKWIRWLAGELGGKQLLAAADVLGDIED